MKFAYADPPYLGCGKKHYGHQHADAADFDGIEAHRALIVQLVTEYPDGWALSLHSPSLRDTLALCPPTVRVAAWVKPFASFKPGVNPGYCWEPVIFAGGRGGAARGRKAPTVRDYVSANVTTGRGTSGAKPEAFCCWLFDLLGLTASDEFHDLFPGSGAVSRAWTNWQWHRSAPEPADVRAPALAGEEPT